MIMRKRLLQLMFLTVPGGCATIGGNSNDPLAS